MIAKARDLLILNLWGFMMKARAITQVGITLIDNKIQQVGTQYNPKAFWRLFQ